MLTKNELYIKTNFLKPSAKTKERLWYLNNNIASPVLCKICNYSPVTFNTKENNPRTYCSSKCRSKDPYVKELTKQTNLKKYGVENPFQNENVKKQIKQTNLERYGAEHPQQNENVKNKTKQTNLERYGVEYLQQNTNFKNKSKETCLINYNVDNPSKSKVIKKKKEETCIKNWGTNYSLQNKTIREKSKQTNLERYGTEHPQQNENVKNKTKQTNLERYGVNNYSSTEECKLKISETNLERYGVKNHTQEKIKLSLDKLTNKTWLLERYTNNSVSDISLELNISQTTVLNYLRKHNIDIKYDKSNGENELYEYIKTICNCEIIQNKRNIIHPHELDIYIPEKNLAFEYNGLYWHSEKCGKKSTYHLNKTLNCEKKNIRLIHIFENEWLYKKEITKSRIAHLLGKSNKIYARKCKIRELNSSDTITFLNNSHIQGYTYANINLGLFYENELVALMSFSKSRFNKNIEYELIRSSNTLNTSIIGGASKLFKYFIKKYNPVSIISYSDKRWNTGNLYMKLGFEKTHSSKPNYFYFKSHDSTLYSRIKFQKHKLNKLLDKFDENLSEYENMKNNGWNRIWDCGNDVWIWNKCLTYDENIDTVTTI